MLRCGLFFLCINRMGLVWRGKSFQRDPSRPFSSFHPETIAIDPFDYPLDRFTVQQSNLHCVTLLGQRHTKGSALLEEEYVYQSTLPSSQRLSSLIMRAVSCIF